MNAACACPLGVMCGGRPPFPEMTQGRDRGHSDALVVESSSIYRQGTYVTKPTKYYGKKGLVRSRVGKL